MVSAETGVGGMSTAVHTSTANLMVPTHMCRRAGREVSEGMSGRARSERAWSERAWGDGACSALYGGWGSDTGLHRGRKGGRGPRGRGPRGRGRPYRLTRRP